MAAVVLNFGEQRSTEATTLVRRVDAKASDSSRRIVFDLVTAVGDYLPIDQDDEKLSFGFDVVEIIVPGSQPKAQLTCAGRMGLPDHVVILCLVVSEGHRCHSQRISDELLVPIIRRDSLFDIGLPLLLWHPNPAIITQEIGVIQSRDGQIYDESYRQGRLE